MNKITISISALFLALGVLSGCGEKKEEAPKADAAPAAEQKPMEQAAAPAAEQAAPEATSSNPMTAMTDAANNAATAMGDAAKAAGDAATQAADSATQAVDDAAKATTEAVSDTAAKAADATTQAVADVTAPDGEKIYKGLCFSCHDMGVAGAPKLGDKAAWAPRIATGMDALHASSLNGKNAMPAKGGNPALSDAEVAAAVDWMVAQSK